MTPRRKRRLALVAVLVLAAAVATSLMLAAFRQNLVYFYTPTAIAKGDAPIGHKFRIGGLVANGSVEHEPDSMDVRFRVTDTANGVPVVYSGVLPDLFREGQGIVVDGRLNSSGVFVADRVLAKHDENYMPPEAAEALKEAGASRSDGARMSYKAAEAKP